MSLDSRYCVFRRPALLLAVIALALAGHNVAIAGAATTSPAPTTAPAPATTAPTTQPSTGPSTQPAPTTAPEPSKPGPNLHVVKRGDLSLDVQADGFLQPVDPFEVRVSFKAYPNPLTITKVVSPGSVVRKGDTLIEFDPTAVEWSLTTANSELAMAKAGLTRAESDARVVAEMDALNLRMTEDAVKNADDAVKWWAEVDGPQMLQNADLGVKQAKDAVDDQADELDQLHKMYKDEELTSATADIVVKRSVRQLEQTKIALRMREQRRDKVKDFDYPIDKAKVTDAAAAAHHQLQALQAAQRQAAVAHEAALTGARLSVEQANRHLNDLKEDAPQFSIKSPIDGTAIYGQLVDGVWVGGDPKLLKVGEKVNPGGVLLRVFTPGKMKVQLPLADGQVFWVEQGMKAKVVPVAAPQISYEATCGQPEPLPHGNPAAFGFQVPLRLPDVDLRLEPGMKVAVHIQAGKVENVLLVPVGAVTAGKATVQLKDNHTEQRDVVLGKSDGQMAEVRTGLNEGDQVILPGKK